jgi:hypothetical protein
MPNKDSLKTVRSSTGRIPVPYSHSEMGIDGLDGGPKWSQKKPAPLPSTGHVLLRKTKRAALATARQGRYCSKPAPRWIGAMNAFVFMAVVGSGLAAHGQLPPTPERSGKETPRPRLFVADRFKEIGEIVEGEKIEIVWRLENHGNADLIITNTRASCGCTVAPLSEEDSVIPPGGHVDFKAHFNSGGRRGEQRQEVTVVSNDPVEPQFGLQFQANVSPLYQVTPPGIVNLRMIRRGDIVDKAVELLPAPGRNKVEIIEIKSEQGGPLKFDHEVVTLGEERTAQRISFIVGDDIPLGRIQSNATVHFRVDGLEREHVLAVRGEVVADLTFRPLVLDLTRQPSIHGKRLAPVVVESTDQRPFDVVSADAGPLFDVTVEAGHGGRNKSAYSVYLTVRNDAAPGPFGSSLVIRTDALDQPMLEVPVFGMVAPRVTTEPAMILLRADDTKIGTHRRLKVQAATPTTFIRPSRVECDIPGVSAKIDERASLPYRHLFFMDVVLTGKASAGRREGTLVIATEAPEIGEIRIPVVVEGRGD